MSKYPTSVKLSPGLMSAVKAQQEYERRQSQTEMIAVLIERGLESVDVLHFNRACALLGITGQREQFSDYRKARGICEYQPGDDWVTHWGRFQAFLEWCEMSNVPEFSAPEDWDRYLAAYDNDAADERNTQKDAINA